MSKLSKSVKYGIDNACSFLNFVWNEDAAGKLFCCFIAFMAFGVMPILLVGLVKLIFSNPCILIWIVLFGGIPAVGLWFCLKHGKHVDDASDDSDYDED